MLSQVIEMTARRRCQPNLSHCSTQSLLFPMSCNARKSPIVMAVCFCFCRYFTMFASSSTSDHTWLSGSSNCDAQLCTRETCQRRRNFGQLLQWLAVASKESDYLSQITNVVNNICTAPVSLSLASL